MFRTSTLKSLSVEYGVSKYIIKKWIIPFKEELLKLGTNPKARVFTPAQTRYIHTQLSYRKLKEEE